MECTRCHTANPPGANRCARCDTPLPLPDQSDATMDGSAPRSSPPVGKPPGGTSTPQVESDATAGGAASAWSSPAAPRTAEAVRGPLQAGSLLGARYEILQM